MKCKYCLLVVFICCTAQILVAQTKYAFTEISKLLPSTEVYDLFLDSKGFLWIGHSQGLSKFDGLKYTNYSHPLQNNISISNICEDGNGTIWANNFGAQIFYVSQNTLQLLTEYDWQLQQNFPTIFTLGQHYLAATHTKGLFLFNTKTRTKTIIPRADGSALDHPNVSKYHNQLLITKDTIWQLFNGKRFTNVRFKSNGKPAILYPRQLGTFNDSIYILQTYGTALGVFTIDTVSNTYTLHRIIEVSQENYKITSLNSSQAWLFGNKQSIFLGKGIDLLQGKKASDILMDKSGTIWIASLQNGLEKINTSTFPYTKTWNNQNTGDELNGLTLHNGTLWAASSQGNVLSLQHDSLVTVAKNGSSLSFQTIQSKNNQLYLGSNKLQRFNTKQNTIEFVCTTSSVKCIEAYKNNIWVGDPYGLIKITDDEKRTTLRAKRCKSVAYYPTTNTVFGVFIDGVFSISNNNATEILFQGNKIYATHLCLLNDTVYIGTLANGVLVYKQQKFLYQITTVNGLASNTVFKVKPFNNSVWILTRSNLEEWMPSKQQLVHHGNSLPFGETTMKDFVVLNNKAYITNGPSLFTYALNQRKTHQPLTVYIDDLFANAIKIDTAVGTQNFELPNGSTNIQFVVSGISHAGMPYFLKYRLQGSDTSWLTVPSSQYQITYAALPAGSYQFEVLAVASDGTESKPATIYFSVAAGWWQNWWLWLGVGLVLCLIVAVIIALKIENINQKNKLIIEKMNLQAHARDGMLAAIRSQMNPHFIFNALNTIQSYIYTNDEDKANGYLGKFSDLIRQILDASQLTHIPLSREISMLQLYLDLELMRFENTLHAKILVDPSVPIDQIEIPPMMVQPYVENAIKHGLLHKPTDRQLTITMTHTQGVLHINIFDNGVGRAKSRQINNQRPKSHQSFATKANQNRLELLNQNRSKKIELSITDHVNHLGVGTGTTVLLTFPL